MVSLFNDLYKSRSIILEITKRDFKNNYIGSNLGFIWTFIQPLVMSIIFWFVFTRALHAPFYDNMPFIIYLITGLFPWNFFSDTLSKSVNVYAHYSFIVKKMNFNISMLPVVKILSEIIIHLFFIIILYTIDLLNGIILYKFLVILVTDFLLLFCDDNVDNPN